MSLHALSDDQASGWHFDNSYVCLPDFMFARVSPVPVRSPRLVQFNANLAVECGLDPAQLNSPAGAEIFAGNQIPAGGQPLAMAYAGHQFGNFVPVLGDGRAHLLGEIIDRHGQRRDLHFKGSGQTPFSRRGDGRAALGPMLREYIISEAMHALGIPTTRSLAVVTTGEAVWRETARPGAILTRVASSHLRVGSFEYLAAAGNREGLKQLADYAIARHYPAAAQQDNPYKAFLAAVSEAQAALIARWMLVGFIHGVMNTDNMTISGETIDYGPCAFMNAYDPATVFSSIDRHGRYAYGNQPRCAQWNIARLAEAILPLLHADHNTAIEIAEASVNQFPQHYDRAWLDGMRRKLGLFSAEPDDLVLVQSLLDLMQQEAADLTNCFRRLSGVPEGEALPAAYQQWGGRWQQRLDQQPQTATEVAALMRAHNPAFIPRNHLVEAALAAAETQDDYTKMEDLLRVLATPYADQPNLSDDYRSPPAAGDHTYQTFCGT